MKVMTILGTRPEIIRLSIIIERLDELSDRHVLVHTGQNYEAGLRDVFFRELNVRQPDYQLKSSGPPFGKQLGTMFAEVDEILERERPDAVLVLGDTNSALSAILAARRHIVVYHMEAGNRCWDPLVPEEVNRRIIDSVATFNLPYTMMSRDNLLREGAAMNRVWVCGNPIYEVLLRHEKAIRSSSILKTLGLTDKGYVLVTAHRAENVDDKDRLEAITSALDDIALEYAMPVVCSVHPRTESRLLEFGIRSLHPLVQMHKPFGLIDFAHLEKHALCALTDSGTVQEECCIFGVPTVTMRQSTERPETVLCGSNSVAGLSRDRIVDAVHVLLRGANTWQCPEGYTDTNVSYKVSNFVLGGLTHV